MPVVDVSMSLHKKVFIDSVIRNMSIALEDNGDDSDDDIDGDDLDKHDSDDESGDDVEYDSDEASSEDDDSDHQHANLPVHFNNLNISYDKDFLDHDHDTVDTTEIGPVDMDTSSTQILGSIECNVPLLPDHEVEGNNPAVRLLSAGYEKEKVAGFESELSHVNEKKFMCSMTSIREFFLFCMDVSCKMPLVEVKERFVGCVLEIRWKCQAGHCGDWRSSKMVNKLYVNNLLAASALLFSGNNYTKMSLFAKFMSLSFFISSTYHQYQKKFLVPQIQSWWKDMQDRMFSVLSNQPIIVAGDGQMDSPGFSAKNCVYTLMHAELDYILHVELVDVRHSNLKSSTMEKVGCQRAMEFLLGKLTISELVTDASSQLIKMLG